MTANAQVKWVIKLRWGEMCYRNDVEVFFWRKLRSKKHIPHQVSFQKEKMSNPNFLSSFSYQALRDGSLAVHRHLARRSLMWSDWWNSTRVIKLTRPPELTSCNQRRSECPEANVMIRVALLGDRVNIHGFMLMIPEFNDTFEEV